MFKKNSARKSGSRIFKHPSAKEVRVSVVFTRLTEIDTINEKFGCEATLFATWFDEIHYLRKNDSDEILYFWDPENHWDPQLYIDNAIGEVKEKDVKYRLEKYCDEISGKQFLEINMIKRIQGVFFEKLELYHFPFDVQDLSITVTSHRPTNEIYINQDFKNQSKVTKHASLDKHIWKLHEHINVKLHTIIADFQLIEDIEGNCSHAAITVQCRVARRPGYYIVNCMLPTLMMILCLFFSFLMDYDRYQYRFTLLFTTMLTSITFRWAIHGRSIPTVNYLTFLDVYCFSSIFMVFLCMVWHCIYCVLHKNDGDLATRYDYYAILAFAIAVILLHIIQLIWYFIALYKRIQLDVLDKESANDVLQKRSLSSNYNNNNNNIRSLNDKKVFYSFARLENRLLSITKSSSNEVSAIPKIYIDNFETKNALKVKFSLTNDSIKTSV